MRAPKDCRENELLLSEELKKEQLEIMRNFLWNEKIPATIANAAITAFNEKWFKAGGLKGNSIVLRIL